MVPAFKLKPLLIQHLGHPSRLPLEAVVLGKSLLDVDPTAEMWRQHGGERRVKFRRDGKLGGEHGLEIPVAAGKKGESGGRVVLGVRRGGNKIVGEKVVNLRPDGGKGLGCINSGLLDNEASI